MQLRRRHNPFETLTRNIIYQQLHGNAAAAIQHRVIALFGRDKLRPSVNATRRTGEAYGRMSLQYRMLIERLKENCCPMIIFLISMLSIFKLSSNNLAGFPAKRETPLRLSK